MHLTDSICNNLLTFVSSEVIEMVSYAPLFVNNNDRRYLSIPFS